DLFTGHIVGSLNGDCGQVAERRCHAFRRGCIELACAAGWPYCTKDLFDEQCCIRHCFQRLLQFVCGGNAGYWICCQDCTSLKSVFSDWYLVLGGREISDRREKPPHSMFGDSSLKIAGFNATTAATGFRRSGSPAVPAGFFPISPRTAFSNAGNCSSNPTTAACVCCNVADFSFATLATAYAAKASTAAICAWRAFSTACCASRVCGR